MRSVLKKLFIVILLSSSSAWGTSSLGDQCKEELVNSGLGDAKWSQTICNMGVYTCMKRIRPYVQKNMARNRICTNYDNLDIALSIVVVLRPSAVGSFSEALRYGSNYSAKKIACALDAFSEDNLSLGKAMSECELEN